ncbi:MAG: hypothetical protein VKJ04_05695 [Vampirovibrionales bacterium]|nr:hypothetical protein [Vampirovibrionales bacterium]
MFPVPSGQNQLSQCDTVRDALLSMLENEVLEREMHEARLLDEDHFLASQDIEAHLTSCPDCLAYRQQLKAALSLLSPALSVEPEAELPDSKTLSDGIMAHVLQEAVNEAQKPEALSALDNPRQAVCGTGSTIIPFQKRAWRWGSLVAAITLLIMAFPLMRGYLTPSGTSSPSDMGQEIDRHYQALSSADEKTIAYIARTEATFDALSGISDGETTRYADPIEDLVGY